MMTSSGLILGSFKPVARNNCSLTPVLNRGTYCSRYLVSASAYSDLASSERFDLATASSMVEWICPRLRRRMAAPGSVDTRPAAISTLIALRMSSNCCSVTSAGGGAGGATLMRPEILPAPSAAAGSALGCSARSLRTVSGALLGSNEDSLRSRIFSALAITSSMPILVVPAASNAALYAGSMTPFFIDSRCASAAALSAAPASSGRT